LGREIRWCSAIAAPTLAAASSARAGATSSDTKPSRPPLVPCSGANWSSASITSVITSSQ
jgi:hypothetical protein